MIYNTNTKCRCNCTLWILFTTTILFLLTSSFTIASQEEVKDSLKTLENDTVQFMRIISRFGREPFYPPPILDTLSRDPRLSVGLLIDSLHVIKNPFNPTTGENFETDHILCIIRALKYLTGGQEFCGSTIHRFGRSNYEQDRRSFLSRRFGNCLSFFAIWPSRGTLYIAPADAQEQIISKWKDWYKTTGKDYEFKPMIDFNYFDWDVNL